MLNPNLIDMIKYAKAKGIKHVAFLTNAELLTQNKCHQLIESGCDWISISADGTDEIYNKIRFPAKFEETVEKYKPPFFDSQELPLRPFPLVCSIASIVSSIS